MTEQEEIIELARKLAEEYNADESTQAKIAAEVEPTLQLIKNRVRKPAKTEHVEMVTENEARKLITELEYLRVAGRNHASDQIRIAREFGDLSENAEYDIAKDNQAKMEAHIIELENRLNNVVIYAKSEQTDIVSMGHKITLVKNGMSEIECVLVGTHQADPMKTPIRISNISPLGTALLGKREGDKVSVKTRSGKIDEYVIKNIELFAGNI